MLKNVLKLFLLSALLFNVSCAAKKVALPSYEGRDFRQFLSEWGRVSGIETRFSIRLEKNDTDLRGDGALDISSNGDMSLRIYSMGFLAMELTSADGNTSSNPPLDRSRTLILTEGLRSCLFWWDVKDFSITDEADYFVLENNSREVRVSRKTFLPEMQKIYFSDGRVLSIYYEDHVVENDVWYHSRIRIELANYSVTLKVKDMSFKM